MWRWFSIGFTIGFTTFSQKDSIMFYTFLLFQYVLIPGCSGCEHVNLSPIIQDLLNPMFSPWHQPLVISYFAMQKSQLKKNILILFSQHMFPIIIAIISQLSLLSQILIQYGAHISSYYITSNRFRNMTLILSPLISPYITIYFYPIQFIYHQISPVDMA